MLQVKELAQQCDVTVDAVRYYTRIGLLQPVRDPVNGYKLFDQKDARHLTFIHRAKQLGYTLTEIRRIFNECNKGNSPCPLVRDIIQHRIRENRIKLENMLALQDKMELTLKEWEKMPDGIPDGDSICTLIESVTDPELENNNDWRLQHGH